jgi:hypothetical protein
MTDQNLNFIAAKVSKSEKTPELGQYWQKRYEKILNKLFVVSEKTSELVLSEDVVENPATPFGDIVLLNHLDANGKLDDTKLQSTVETATRFLDACLDVINFSDEAKFIVTQYRKIGIGLADIQEFLEKNENSSELQNIDHLGNLISNSAYRASETVAEEKSPCSNWNKINKHLRPRSFELWINPSGEERHSGLALSEEFDEETILDTDFQIIPRRNSNILLFPPDLEWQIWSDRDNLAPVTNIIEYQAPAPEVDLEDSIEEEEKEEELEEKPDLKPEQDLSEVEEIKEPIEEVKAFSIGEDEPQSEITNKQSEHFDLKQTKTKEVKPTKAEESVVDEEVQPEEGVQALIKEELVAEKTTEHEDEALEGHELVNPALEMPIFDFGVKPETEEAIEIEPPDQEMILEGSQDDEVEDDSEALQIGELVQIVKKDDPQFGKIYQIIDAVEGDQNPTRYHIAGGNPEIEKVLWSENDLEPVDLDELLININSKTPEDDLIREIEAEADRKKNLEVALYKEQLREEMEQKMLTEKPTLPEAQNSQEIEILKAELNKSKQEITQLKNKLQPSKESEPNKAEMSLDELEEKISQRVKEYIASADYKNELNRLVQQKTANLKNNFKSPIASSISTLKMMKKYQNLK